MSYSQTQTQSKSGYKAGVQDYRLTYYMPDYTPKDTDILAAYLLKKRQQPLLLSLPRVPGRRCGQIC
jgi:hypothetical protein